MNHSEYEPRSSSSEQTQSGSSKGPSSKRTADELGNNTCISSNHAAIHIRESHDTKRVKTDHETPTNISQDSPHNIVAQTAVVVEDNITPSRGNMILSRGNSNETHRWRSHRMAEDYIQLSSQMMMPGIHLAPFGYDASSGQFPIESVTALSILLSPLRRPTVVEKWSPFEIAVFEAALAMVGKEFHQVQKFVQTKNTKEIIEFYYIWKKTAHYKVWKRQYILPEDDVDSDDD